MPAWRWGTNLLDKNAPSAMRMVAPGKAAVASAQPDVRSEHTNSWDEVEAALGPYREDLDLVRAAAQYPVWDFNLDYHQGFVLLLPHLAPIKRSVQYLTTEELCELRRGEVAAATTNVEAMLGAVKATAGEPLVISQLVRISIAQLSMGATWELLQAPNVTDEQLAALQRDWLSVHFAQPAQSALAMERALNQMTIEQMRKSDAQFRKALSIGRGGSPTSIEDILRAIGIYAQEARWRYGLSYPDQLRMLKGHQVLLDIFHEVGAGQPFAPALQRQAVRLAAMGLPPTNSDSGPIAGWPGDDWRALFSSQVVSLTHLINRVLVAEAARELTVTALALKRYQLTHGQYPAELSTLVPQFLSTVPQDPAGGKSLRYHLNPDGTFLLYSVGEDGIDNGGDTTPPKESTAQLDPKLIRSRAQERVSWPQKARDLVWPLPASSEEIDAYHQRNEAEPQRATNAAH